MKRATRWRRVASFTAATAEPTARAVSRVCRHAERLAREADDWSRAVTELREPFRRHRDALPKYDSLLRELPSSARLVQHRPLSVGARRRQIKLDVDQPILWYGGTSAILTSCAHFAGTSLFEFLSASS